MSCADECGDASGGGCCSITKMPFNPQKLLVPIPEPESVQTTRQSIPAKPVSAEAISAKTAIATVPQTTKRKIGAPAPAQSNKKRKRGRNAAVVLNISFIEHGYENEVFYKAHGPNRGSGGSYLCFVDGCKKQAVAKVTSGKNEAGIDLTEPSKTMCRDHALALRTARDGICIKINGECVNLKCDSGARFPGYSNGKVKNGMYCGKCYDDLFNKDESLVPPKPERQKPSETRCRMEGCNEVAYHRIKTATSKEYTHCNACAKKCLIAGENMYFSKPVCNGTDKCARSAYWGPLDGNKETCCDHKKPGYIDFIHKSAVCIVPGCKTGRNGTAGRAIAKIGKFGSLDYCAKHGTEVNNPRMVFTEKLCEQNGCHAHANFGPKGSTTPSHCFDCKPTEYVDIMNPTCKVDMCLKRYYDPNTEREGYCPWCFVDRFPNHPYSLRYLPKQAKVTVFIKEELSGALWNTDRRINLNGSRRRPDLWAYVNGLYIIVEIDEERHRGVKKPNETAREKELLNECDGKRLVLVRFNPDEYNNVPSPWVKTSDNIIRVAESREKEWNARLQTLKNVVNEYIIGTKTATKLLTRVRLYYSDKIVDCD